MMSRKNNLQLNSNDVIALMTYKNTANNREQQPI